MGKWVERHGNANDHSRNMLENPIKTFQGCDRAFSMPLNPRNFRIKTRGRFSFYLFQKNYLLCAWPAMQYHGVLRQRKVDRLFLEFLARIVLNLNR
jgi:hypothetical protein